MEEIGFFRKNRNLFCRMACIHFFALEGVLAGVWASQLPEIQDRADLSDSSLGLCGLFVYFGTVSATPLAGFLIRHLGSKWATISGAIVFVISLPLIGLDFRFSSLVCTMFLFGAAMGFVHIAFLSQSVLGVMDVSMNASGVVAELVEGIPLMGSFHGSYSIAAALGSLIGSVLSSTDWSPLQIFLLTSALLMTTTVLFGGGLYKRKDEAYYNSHQWKLQHHRDASDEELTSTLLDEQCVKVEGTVPQSPSYSLQYLCAVGFLGSYGEGALVTWSVIYFERYIPVPSSLQALGFFCFMTSMAVGRFTCDWLRKRLGRRQLIRIAGVLAGSGLGILVLSPSLDQRELEIAFSVLGVILTGLGLSTIVPTVFSSAGHLPLVHAGTSIATVAAFTYCGSIAAPPIIGALSQTLHSLRLSFIFIAALVSLICPLSFGVPAELSSSLSTTRRDLHEDSEEQSLLQPPGLSSNFHSSPLLSFTSSDDRQTM